MTHIMPSAAVLCAVFLLSGCNSPAAQHMQRYAKKIQAHAAAVSAASVDAAERASVGAAPASVSAAAVIGAAKKSDGVIDTGDGAFATIERRYISLTGQPCVLAQLGSYEREEMLEEGGYFAPQSRILSCKRNGKWSFYPYFGDSLGGESS